MNLVLVFLALFINFRGACFLSFTFVDILSNMHMAPMQWKWTMNQQHIKDVSVNINGVGDNNFCCFMYEISMKFNMDFT